jgi:hypothetical protein
MRTPVSVVVDTYHPSPHEQGGHIAHVGVVGFTVFSWPSPAYTLHSLISCESRPFLHSAPLLRSLLALAFPFYFLHITTCFSPNCARFRPFLHLPCRSYRLGVVAHRSLLPEAWCTHCASLLCEAAETSGTIGRLCLNVVNFFFRCVVSRGCSRLQGP